MDTLQTPQLLPSIFLLRHLNPSLRFKSNWILNYFWYDRGSGRQMVRDMLVWLLGIVLRIKTVPTDP